MEICEIGESRRLAMREEGRQLSSQTLCSFLEGWLTGNCPLAGGSMVALGDLFDEYIIPTLPSAQARSLRCSLELQCKERFCEESGESIRVELLALSLYVCAGPWICQCALLYLLSAKPPMCQVLLVIRESEMSR